MKNICFEVVVVGRNKKRHVSGARKNDEYTTAFLGDVNVQMR